MNAQPEKGSAIEVKEANFDAEVIKSPLPVLVEFWAPWSRPCQVIEPVLADLAADRGDKFKLVKVNADDTLDLSMAYDIQSIPTLIFFVDGKPRLRIVGTATKEAILAKLAPFAATVTPPG